MQVPENQPHLFETAMDNRLQSCPELAYGLAGCGRTSASTFALRNVAHHDDIEFKGMEEVRSFSNGLNVVIKPARDMGRAELCTT
jgi:hypothetical protein